MPKPTNQAKINGLRVRELVKQIKSSMERQKQVKKIKMITTPLELWFFDGKYSVPPLAIQVKDPICNFTGDVVSTEMLNQWDCECIGWIHIDSETKKCYLLGFDWIEVADLLVCENLAYYVQPEETT